MADEWKQGFPRYFYQNDRPIVYEVLTRDDEIILAIVDASTQYRAEGLRWVDPITRRYIDGEFFLKGWREFQPPTKEALQKATEETLALARLQAGAQGQVCPDCGYEHCEYWP